MGEKNYGVSHYLIPKHDTLRGLARSHVVVSKMVLSVFTTSVVTKMEKI